MRLNGYRLATQRSTPLYDRLIEQLVHLRKQRGMTQWDVNAAIGCTDSLVAKWETGMKYPTFRHMLLWCHVLDVELTLKEKIDGRSGDELLRTDPEREG